MTSKATKPRKRSKQNYFDGMAPPSIPDLDQAIDRYVEARDRRMEALKDEVEAKAALMEKMSQMAIEKYTTPDDFVATLEAHNELHVKRRKSETANGQE